MCKIKSLIVLLFIIGSFFQLSANTSANLNPDLLVKDWDAFWISYPNIDPTGVSILHFRKSVHLDNIPAEYLVHVSADNRYRLFVNGKAVCFGPARSDVRHWNFETVNIAPYLTKGVNTVAAVVWNFGIRGPQAQMTYRTAFILQGNSAREQDFNTNASWKVFKNISYDLLTPVLPNYIDVGPGESVNGESYPWGWESVDFKDDTWLGAQNICKGRPKGKWSGPEWDLVPRDIPFLSEKQQYFTSVRRSSGITVPKSFLSNGSDLIIPANSTVSILLDQGEETVAYPELTVTSGKGSEVEMIYAEGLFDKDWNKGNRNEVEGKFTAGLTDKFRVGSFTGEQLFRPLWYRTFRYVELNIKTADVPLVLKKLSSVFTVYPFEQTGSFKSDNPKLNQIWETGWHTLQLCSNETHYDCPYYEQLQYVGDTRIQCLISAYVSKDDRLTRKAIELFDASRMHEGLTNSRYPSKDVQIITPFSLFWINMVHDYWMLKNNPEYVKQFLFGVENILHFYEDKIDPTTNMLGRTPYWNFVDWPDEWAWSFVTNSGGVPQGGAEGGSSILTFQLASTLYDASELFDYYGSKAKAKHYRELAQKINKSTVEKCWDARKGLFADTPEKTEYSQHANIMAVLSKAKLPVKSETLLQNSMANSSIIQATIYYRFYLYKAMKLAGMADQYLSNIDAWYKMLDYGLTTFSERLDPTRSDCHAWSASPTYDLLATVCGVEPAECGFKSVKIEPHLGDLKWVEATIPHQKGVIKLKFNKDENAKVTGEIVLPVGLKGVFVYQKKKLNLHEGTNKIGK